MRWIKENTTLIGISELRSKSQEILKQLEKGEVVLENRHQPVAVLMPIAQYERWGARMEEIEDIALAAIAKDRESKSSPKNYLPIEKALQIIRKRST